MEPVLVTGHGGFVGRHLAALMGEAFVPLDADVLDADAVAAAVRDVRPSAVAHLAAESSVSASWDDAFHAWLFAARLRKLSSKITVVNYGCPGESTVTFARGGCDWLKHGGKLHDAFRGSQLKAALSFLRAHPEKVSPITLTLWGNDLPLPLSQNAKRAPRAIASFASRFSAILRQLRAAAPTAEIIVTGAWNPEADRLAQTTASTASAGSRTQP